MRPLRAVESALSHVPSRRLRVVVELPRLFTQALIIIVDAVISCHYVSLGHEDGNR